MIKREIITEQIKAGQKSIGVVAPFRLQANELQNVIDVGEIEVDTVHKYQGREKDIIILSTVSNHMKASDFADNENSIEAIKTR